VDMKSAIVSAFACLTLVVTASSNAHGAEIWGRKAPMPVAMDEVGVAAVGGRVYVVGGQTRDDPHAALTWEYDPATNAWRARAPMPQGLSHPAVTALDGKVYVFGGFLTRVHPPATAGAPCPTCRRREDRPWPPRWTASCMSSAAAAQTG